MVRSGVGDVRFGSKADISMLYTRKRTLVERVGMSVLCQKQTSAATLIGLT